MSFATAGMVGKPLPVTPVQPREGPGFSNTATVDYRTGHAAALAPHPYAPTQSPWVDLYRPNARMPVSMPYDDYIGHAHRMPVQSVAAPCTMSYDHKHPGKYAGRTSSAYARNIAGDYSAASAAPTSNEEMDRLTQNLSQQYMSSIGTKPAARSMPVSRAARDSALSRMPAAAAATTALPPPRADVLVKVSQPAANASSAEQQQLQKDVDELRTHVRSAMQHIVTDRKQSQDISKVLNAVVDKLQENKKAASNDVQAAIRTHTAYQNDTKAVLHAVLDKVQDMQNSTGRQMQETYGLVGEIVDKMEKQKRDLHSLSVQQNQMSNKVASTGTKLNADVVARLASKTSRRV